MENRKTQLRKEFGQAFRQIVTQYYPKWRDADPTSNSDVDDLNNSAASRNHDLGISPRTAENWMYKYDQGVQRSAYYGVIGRMEKAKRVPQDEIAALNVLYERMAEVWANGDLPDTRQEELPPPPLPVLTKWVYLLATVTVLSVVGVVVILLTRPLANRPVSAETWVQERSTIGGLPMVKVPAGCFNMGTLTGRADEQPVSQVCFDKAFWIGETEVTIEQYGSQPDAECNTNKVALSGLVNCVEGQCPRNCVTWDEANAFCAAHELGLPTEAEWEYAGRSPDGRLYPWGNSPIYGYAIVRTNFSTNAIGGTMFPVASKPQDISWVGAYDMAGSLREFTSTIYDTVTVNGERKFPYPYNATDGREDLANTGTSTNVQTRDSDTTIRVVRGGSFDFGIEKATLTIRNTEYWDFLWNDYGFRCVSDS